MSRALAIMAVVAASWATAEGLRTVPCVPTCAEAMATVEACEGTLAAPALEYPADPFPSLPPGPLEIIPIPDRLLDACVPLSPVWIGPRGAPGCPR